MGSNPPDYSSVGATGGGYTLSSGVETKASIDSGGGVSLEVNGDPFYPGRTTLTAARMLMKEYAGRGVRLGLKQKVSVPIGYGFGASAASALSAVMAVSAALELDLPREKVAYFAHAADIMCHTGLGTVSSTYDHTGAGLVVKAGAPGVAVIRRIEVPPDVWIVTASLAPYRKSSILLAPRMKRKVNALGEKALRKVKAAPSLRTLGEAGEEFSEGLGLMTTQVRSLVTVAKENGALYASQNMVGHAVHALVPRRRVKSVARAIRSLGPAVLVGVYEIGTRETSAAAAP